MKLANDRLQASRVPLLAAPVIPLALLAGAFAFSAGLAEVSLIALAGIALLLYLASIAYLGRIIGARAEIDRDDANADSLNDLPGRRDLHRDIDDAHATGQEVAIAMLDLDRFKLINDHYGHHVGDQLIRECARAIERHSSSEAMCYRLGGDEFALVMSGPAAGNILEGICRNILAEFDCSLNIENVEINVGVSIGLTSSIDGDELSSSELLRRSDVALQASKRWGRRRCTWFSAEIDRNREAQCELDGELRHALANEEFELHYQPLVDAATQEIVAIEALIRWRRPDGRQIGPQTFIPVAEESGLINEIGLWVLRRACLDALHWGDIKLSVNLSSAQLRNADFPVQLGMILEETGFPADRLELEITETCLVLDPVVAERNLEVIRRFGVNIALDDFGTGYASIGFLRQFRFEKLKLDRSLVVDAGFDEGSRAMMLSSITVARALNMGVAAEGVETQEQADMVRIAGCDQIQGWLYYKAMPAAEIRQYLPEAEVRADSSTPSTARGAQ